MNAAILTEKNKPLLIDEISIEEPLSFGQVKVKILTSGLCGAQLQEIAGLKNNEKFMPHLLGHEGCGIVEEFDKNVKKVKKGDKVILHWRKGSGLEADFPKYRWKDKIISGGKITTLSEYAIVSENRLTVVDQSINNYFCALLGCGLSTGFNVVNVEANLKFGESVLVLGCGGVGLNCLLASKLSLGSPIVGVDINPAKKTLVESNGCYFYDLCDLKLVLDKYKTFDCIIDTTGNLDLVSSCVPHLSERGRCIFVSQPKPNSSLLITNPSKFFSSDGLTFKTTQAGNFNPDVDIPRYVKLYLEKIINLDKIITDYYCLNDINKAFDKLKSGSAGRIMINL